MNSNLRLTTETERPEANCQAHAPPSLHDLARQFLSPLIEQVVSETIARLESARVEKVPADDGPTLWTWKDVAEHTRMSRRALERLEAVGGFGPRRLKLGTAVRFYRAEVEDWFAAQCPKRADWHWRRNGQEIHRD